MRIAEGFSTNKLFNIVGWAGQPALDLGRAVRPTPQEIVGYFFIWKSLKIPNCRWGYALLPSALPSLSRASIFWNPYSERLYAIINVSGFV